MWDDADKIYDEPYNYELDLEDEDNKMIQETN